MDNIGNEPQVNLDDDSDVEFEYDIRSDDTGGEEHSDLGDKDDVEDIYIADNNHKRILDPSADHIRHLEFDSEEGALKFYFDICKISWLS